MARYRDGIKERKCGCLYYQYGPPVKCHKHESKEVEGEKKRFRRLLTEHAESLGHRPTRWEADASDSRWCKGKWTMFCQDCGFIGIAYDAPIPGVDQMSGRVLQVTCKAKREAA
jgi:hypothetical protein